MTTENGKGSIAYKTCAFCPSCQSVATRRVLPLPPNHPHNPRIPFPQEGRLAIVTDVGSGMRWTRKRCAQFVARTNDAFADGEIVWSWRPDAGAKSMVRPIDDGGKRARSPGRARISRKTIVQGMPDVSGEPVVADACAFCCTGGRGSIGHPAFPAPSLFMRDKVLASLGRNAPRERKRMFAHEVRTTIVIASEAK